MGDQIEKTTQDLTTATEMRAITQMLMQPNANWEQYLAPAPLSLAIMGELVFISSGTDFSISKKSTDVAFKYIRYPDSFRACLMQVCNTGWHAFNMAHKNMDQIRIYTSNVPDYMREAVKILFQGNDEVVKALLPSHLDSLSNIADECVTLAQGVEQKYADVINLIQELLEACINANHFYGEELENIKRKIEEGKLREKTAQELNEMSKKAMDAMSKQLEEAHDVYRESMKNLPSGWEMIGMDFVEQLTHVVNAFTSIPTAVGGLYRKARNRFKREKTSSESDVDPTDDGSDSDEEEVREKVDIGADMIVLSKSGQILNLVGAFSNFVSGNEINWAALYDQKKKCLNSGWIKDLFGKITQELDGLPYSKLKESAIFLCEEAIGIWEELEYHAPGEKLDKHLTKQLIKKMKKLSDEAYKFDSKCKKKSCCPAVNPKPPMMYKTKGSGHESASRRASENARFRIEQSREQMRESRELYNGAVKNMEKNQKELNDILVEMHNCEIKEIDFNTTIKMLGKGMEAMGRVKEQWEKMVQFFQMMATIVKAQLSHSLKKFVMDTTKTMTLSYNSRLFAKDMLYNQAFQASNIASLVHMISGTYCEVSNKYLMDKVSRLGKLMTMDKEDPKFMTEREMLREFCTQAQEDILQLVKKNQKEFEGKTNARMEKIEGALKAVMPTASPQETARIREIVEAGFTEEEEEEAELEKYI